MVVDYINLLLLLLIINFVNGKTNCELLKSSNVDENCKLLEQTTTIIIGDVHGHVKNLREVLFHSNITLSRTSCDWNPLTDDLDSQK